MKIYFCSSTSLHLTDAFLFIYLAYGLKDCSDLNLYELNFTGRSLKSCVGGDSNLYTTEYTVCLFQVLYFLWGWGWYGRVHPNCEPSLLMGERFKEDF